MSDPFEPTQPVGSGATSPAPGFEATAPAFNAEPVFAAPAPGPQPFTFTGSGSEYFRIWIVNLLLTIVTLSIYSAWAKVRRMKYFYNNTHVAGSSFEYHGQPIPILKGRAIAFAVFGGYSLLNHINPFLGIAASLVLYGLLPWLLWKSMRFKLHNSSWGGVRFGFDGKLSGAYLVFLALPLLFMTIIGIVVGVFAAIAVGLAAAGMKGAALFIGVIGGLLFFATLTMFYPFWHQRLKIYQHRNSRFGTSQFAFDAPLMAFIKAYLFTGLILLVMMVILGSLGAGSVVSVFNRDTPPTELPFAVILVIIGFYAVIFAVMPILNALVQNVVWNHTQLEQHGFASNLPVGKAVFVALTNVLGVICTLGLFLPFAHIRALKLKVEAMTFLPAGPIDDVLASASADIGATGEGMADIMDFDIGM
jgi:uncharacterized membrane protein YjgN (DUF898 family)